MADHVDMTCGQCGVEFCMPTVLYNARRNDGECFYCPNGHARVFKDGPKDRRIKELEERIEDFEKTYEHLMEVHDEAWAGREEALGAMKECPLACGYRSRRQVARDPVAMGRGIERVHRDMVEHLVTEHGARPEPIKQIPERTGVAHG